MFQWGVQEFGIEAAESVNHDYLITLPAGEFLVHLARCFVGSQSVNLKRFYVRKQHAHAGAIMNRSNRLSKERCDGNRFQLLTIWLQIRLHGVSKKQKICKAYSNIPKFGIFLLVVLTFVSIKPVCLY